jgi:hypothetical protein
LTPITLLEHLQQQKPDVDWIPLQRTLQRRVREWKALHGPDPEVIFPLSYEPGEIAFCDFTQLKGVEVTIAGQAFPHLLFHYRLAWSGWSYTQVVQGRREFCGSLRGVAERPGCLWWCAGRTADRPIVGGVPQSERQF